MRTAYFQGSSCAVGLKPVLLGSNLNILEEMWTKMIRVLYQTIESNPINRYGLQIRRREEELEHKWARSLGA
jgi:hypothetical protein